MIVARYASIRYRGLVKRLLAVWAEIAGVVAAWAMTAGTNFFNGAVIVDSWCDGLSCGEPVPNGGPGCRLKILKILPLNGL
jgi:hypothetical protein